MQETLPMLETRLSRRITEVLTPLCVALHTDQISSLRDEVRSYCLEIRRALAYNEFLDIETIECIGKALECLLDAYDTFVDAHRALIVGATRYFLQADDVEPDTISILGFDDDTAVLNAVLEIVGRDDLKTTP